MLTLNQHDRVALGQRGLSPSQIEDQFQQLRQGMPPLHLDRPCRIDDGIIQLSSQHTAHYHQQFHIAHAAGRISKFIPASGAATRMFKDLLQVLEKKSPSQAIDVPVSSLPEPLIKTWKHLHLFPFVDELHQYFETQGTNLEDLYQNGQFTSVFRALLYKPGLGYAHLPKALLAFHCYPSGPRTSLEEQVQEAMMYAQSIIDPIRIHLTVSSQFQTMVKSHIDMIQQKFSRAGSTCEITVSIQKPSTDTIALDSQEQLFRDNAEQLLFRPGGHGALLENLNDYEGDIVCISNIDNVVPDYLKGPVVEWRKSLAGYLIVLQDKIFHHLTQLQSPQSDTINNTKAFIQDYLHDRLMPSYEQLDLSGQITHLQQFLNRPLRICGVVQNTGDPGGGPFWVQHTDGSHSRQIVEQSQADSHSETQRQLFSSATHFNPVDMVCGLRDYQGRFFNLLKFRDPNTSFISQKTYQGRPLKALEWPGLWNGGMANWITIFVEIPRATFNPVKTFLDWLHPHHQPPS